MGVPRVYRKTQRVVPSFDYLDFASGRGYRNFYAAAGTISGSTVYMLTNQTINASFGVRSYSNASNNFDLLFNNSSIVDGDVLITYTLTGDGTADGRPKFTFTKVAASGTTTALNSVIGGQFSVAGGGTKRFSLKVDIPRTNFAIGDILRVAIDVNTHRVAGTITIYVDPSSLQSISEHTSGLTVATNCIIGVPFVVVDL